jgi:creatinine amidohydrolase
VTSYRALRSAWLTLPALTLSIATTAANATAQTTATPPQPARQRPAPVEVVRPKDQRVPAPYSLTMDRPVAMPDNLWMSELTILEMRDLVNVYGYRTALIMNGTMEANGPYLTTGKHNHVLKVTGDAIARTLGKTLIAPIVMLDGGNPSTTTQPGRLVLSNATLTAVLTDMATSLKAQGFTEVLLIGDSGSNQSLLRSVAADLTKQWAGQNILVAHIPEYYNYADVLKYQNDVLGVTELNKDLDGYHDDHYISALIMNDDPRHVRYAERVKVGLDHINSVPLVLDRALAVGKKIAQFRADVTVAAVKKARAAHATSGGRD